MLPEIHVFALPLKHPFRGVSVREGVLFEGPNGWAEFAPFMDYDDELAGRWLTAAIEQAYGEWPSPKRSKIPVNAIVPIVDTATTRSFVEEALAVLAERQIAVGHLLDGVRHAVLREAGADDLGEARILRARAAE